MPCVLARRCCHLLSFVILKSMRDQFLSQSSDGSGTGTEQIMTSAKTSNDAKVAIVTGAGRGIGRAIAQRLASAGASVGILARNHQQIAETVRLISEAGGQAMALPADIADPVAVRKAAKTIEKSFGPVDALVNNAGVVTPFGPFWETDEAEWWRSFQINLRGPVLCTRAVLPGMVERRRGRIVNVSSGAGTMASPYYSSYIVSKTALIRFTECLALETQAHDVAVFAISPGTVRTSMSEYSLNSSEGRKWLPWFRRMFDEKIDVPVERPVQLVQDLLSGRFDALSGRMLSVFDDLDMLRREAAVIDQQNLYSLKLQKLQGAGANPAYAAILAAARNAAKSSG